MLHSPAEIKIGTSGFSYPGQPPKGWYGAFYPEKKSKGFDELKYFSQIFPACEINQTFYRPPTAKTTQGWVDKTPDDFLFTVKLWQKFTHREKIFRTKPEEEWESATQQDYDEFRQGILPLAESGKLGALLLQYPSSFKYSRENLDKLQNTLRWFYDYAKVIELRHVSWSDNEAETRKLLEEFRTSQALIDEPKFKDSIRQGLETAGTIFYFRAHGRNAKTWFHAKQTWERYDYLYSREEVQQHAQKIKAAASTPGVQRAFAFYNNHAKAQAPANAIMLSQELGVRLRGMPPEAMVTKFRELVQRRQ
jgi:uncharacterized protein YecE (DUF72 family)